MTQNHKLSRRLTLKSWSLAVLSAAAGARPALADDASAHAHHDHAAHMTKAASTATRRSVANYTPAPVRMIRQDGVSAPFAAALDDGRPVLLNFIFTSCTAICPVTSQVFSQVIDKLGAHRAQVNVVSVSIDPEYDSPARLEAYAQRFGGRREAWSLFTGSSADSIAVQKSFASYQGDKMNHVPVTFLRRAPGQPWVRLDGFATPEVLMAELHGMLGH